MICRSIALPSFLLYISIVKALHRSYQQFRAPELYGDHWFNGDPISLRDLQGDAVLLFFWDAALFSSIKMLSVIAQWHTRYAPLGAVFIGVHSSGFPFVKHPDKVEAALRKHAVRFPVVSDNERVIANAYRITTIPSIVLIDAAGNVYDVASQNFSVLRVERSLQYLLRQAGFFGELPQLQSYGQEEMLYHAVPEIYAGYLNGSLGNPEGYSPELPAMYDDPLYYSPKKFYAHGIWRAEKNAFVYAGEPNDGYLVFRSDGDDVDVLIGSDQRRSVQVLVDGAPVPVANMGREVQCDAKGKTNAVVNEPQSLSLFRAADDSPHTVKMIPSAAGISFYVFSFDPFRPERTVNDSFRNN